MAIATLEPKSETPLPERLYTAQDLASFPSDVHYELIQGKLRKLNMPTGEQHGEMTALLSFYLMQYIVPGKLGKGYAAETGFLLSHNPDVVKAPDFAFVASGRLPAAPTVSGFVPVAPDLVVETRSPSDYNPAVQEKVEEWLGFGVRLVLVLDPSRKTLTRHEAGSEPVTLTETDTLTGGAVLPGFSLPLVDVFNESVNS